MFLAGSISQSLISGSIAQDIISIPLSLILALLSIVFLQHPGEKSLIAILGLAWYFFYAFGLYTIQGQYTSIYLVYLAIFGLSVYSMIFGLLSFKADTVRHYQLPGALRKAISIFLIVILVILVPGWLLKMMPDLAKHIPGDTYGVYILDLCLVFPAFGIIAVQLLRNKPFGNILAGVALLKGLTLCLSWAFSELTAPLYGKPLTYDMAVISSALTVLSLVLFVPYMLKLHKEVTAA